MSTMKTIIPTVSLFIFSLILTACGGGGGDNPPPGGGTKPTGSISLSWDIPSTKADGNALSLSEIDGYKIYLTKDNTIEPNQAYLEVKDSSTTDYTISGLQAGKYYLYITTYDVSGDESKLSDPVSTTI